MFVGSRAGSITVLNSWTTYIAIKVNSNHRTGPGVSRFVLRFSDRRKEHARQNVLVGVRRWRLRLGFVAVLISAVIPLAAWSQQRPGQLTWPKQMGAFTAASSKATPAFPHDLSGYRSEDGTDFWGKPFSATGTLRIFQGKGWQGIPKFPDTMNGCSSGVFMIRWRSASPDLPVQSSLRYSAAAARSRGIRTGAFGYISGTNCEQPMFNFGDSARPNGATLADIN